MYRNFYKKKGKRIFDLIFALIIFIPVVLICLPFLLAVWLNDLYSPLFFAKRVGYKSKSFFLIKIRSMIINADKTDIISTKNTDKRITKVGAIIRKYKIDELPQIINIILGQISFVGPRPNTYKHGVELYNEKEMEQLDILPGITDLSSIVFCDEAEILEQSNDPDKDYNELIRPWKSKLGLLYKDISSLKTDLKIILLTILNLFNRKLALKKINRILIKYSKDKELINICKRNTILYKGLLPK